MGEYDSKLAQYFSCNTWSENTEDRYRRALSLFLAEVTDLASLDSAGFKAWLTSHNWGASSQWIALNAIKGFIRWQFGDNHPALTIKIKAPRSAPQRVLNMRQIKILLASFNTAVPKGIRDLAMAGLMLDSGLRVSEICHLETDRLYYEPDLDAYMLSVIVKGGDWSTRSFSVYTAGWVENWVGVRAQVLAKRSIKDHGLLFVGVGGMTPGQPMTRHGLQRVVKEWGKVSGIGMLSPHDLRRSMASNATILGGPEDIVMKGGGWHSSSVFRRYTVGVQAAHMVPYHPTLAAMRH